MRINETSIKRTLLTGCFLVISILYCLAQDSLYIYRNGQILYRSQADQIDSVTFHLPEYWDWKESDAVYQKIRSYPELSIFADMLDQTGYKDKLNDKTIWAPVNASFAGVDLSDGALVKKLVENHLSNSANAIDSNRFYPINTSMLSHKSLELNKVNGQILMDGNPIIQPNIRVSTSIIHILNGYLPYRENLWEYLSSAGSIDSMRAFLFSYNKKTYSPLFNDTVISNDLLTTLYADLNVEWKKFDVLIPTDKAWNAMLESLMSIYPPSTNQSLRAQQRTNAKLYIIKNLFLTYQKDEPFQDTVYTTQLNKINNPKEQFGEASLLATLSNGHCYFISKLDIPLTLHNGLCLEAEDSTYRYSLNCRITCRQLKDNPSYQISNNTYTHSQPLTSSNITKVYTNYYPTNLRPGKYNIYALFVPAYAEDSTLLQPYKVNFYLTYPDSAGVIVSAKAILSNVVTNQKMMSKVLVQQNFVFNLLDPQINGTNISALSIRIENAAKVSESATLSREIRTDCILFEPVE